MVSVHLLTIAKDMCSNNKRSSVLILEQCLKLLDQDSYTHRFSE